MASRYKKERPRCPFYGFAPEGKYLMDMRQNNCGLLMPILKPCKMETSGLAPDVSQCRTCRIGESQWNEMFWDYVVFPDELQPEEGGLTGVPFGIWAGITGGRLFADSKRGETEKRTRKGGHAPVRNRGLEGANSAL